MAMMPTNGGRLSVRARYIVASALTTLMCVLCGCVSPGQTAPGSDERGEFLDRERLVSVDAIEKMRATDAMFEESNRRGRLIDAAYPGPPVPDLERASPEEVLEVTKSGLIVLASGARVRLAGMLCTDGLQRYFDAMDYRARPKKVVLSPTAGSSGEVVAANAWLLQLSGDSQSVGLTDLNESALVSRWCVPVPENGHNYYERYLLLWLNGVG